MVSIRHYQDHWALQGREEPHSYLEVSPDPRLPRGTRDFWRRVHFGPCTGGVVARHHGEIVGICRYAKNHKAAFGELVDFEMAGTWVARQHRRDGLATRMWRLVLKKLPRGTQVYCTVVSRGGYHLVTSLALQYPRLGFQVNYTY